MRRFEVLDSLRPECPACATLSCDQASGTFVAEVAPWAGPNDVPVQFAPFVERGERIIPEHWATEWVEERVAPPSRQNIGEVLRVHGLDRYDACELLASSGGRSSQDDFYLREVTEGFTGAVSLGRELARERARSGMTQGELAEKSGVRQETISRLERGHANPALGTVERIAAALGKRVSVRIE